MLAFQEEEGAGLGQRLGKSCWAGVLLQEGSTGEKPSPQRSLALREVSLAPCVHLNPALQSPFPWIMVFEAHGHPHERMETPMRKMRAGQSGGSPGSCSAGCHGLWRVTLSTALGLGAAPLGKPMLTACRESKGHVTPLFLCYSYLNHSWVIVSFLEALN